MFHAVGSSLKFLMCALVLAAAGLVAVPTHAQQKTRHANQAGTHAKLHSRKLPDFARYQARPDGSMPMIQDWSNQHVIYTANYTAEQADRMAKDPRAYASFLAHGLVHRRYHPIQSHHGSKHETLKRDWAVPLGNGIFDEHSATFPAKFTFDVNATPSCTNDFVVFPVPASTGSSRAHVAGTFTADPVIGQTVSITITPADSGPATLTLTAGTTNSGTSFAVSGTNNTITDGFNLAAAINRNLSSSALDEIAALAPSGTVTVYALTAGTGVTLTVANSLGNLSWGQVTPGVNGSQANIVGFSHLYAGSGSPLCTGYTYPTFTFSYAAGTGGVITSPVLSLDGQQIAFVETDAALGTILHVLTLGTGTEYGSCSNDGTSAPTCATAAVIPGSTPGSNAIDYMLPLDLAGSVPWQYSGWFGDSDSSPFVDYSTNVLYVGDNTGYLFSVSSVFGGGAPALAGGFPVLLNLVTAMGSPVVDVGNTGDTLIEDAYTDRLYDVTSDGTVKGSIPIGLNDEASESGPVVDSTNGVGYAVSACNGISDNYPIAVQFSTAGANSPQLLATAHLSGPCVAGLPMISATPDNNYFTKGISNSSPGNNGDFLVAYDTHPGSLAQIQFSSGILNSTAEYTDTDNGGFNLGNAFSPLTEFYGNDKTFTINDVAQNGNAVTVTTTANAFVSNQMVVISGVEAATGSCTSAVANAINGEQTVTVTSPTTFTFTSPLNATIGGGNGSCILSSALVAGPTQDYLFLGTNISGIFTFDLPLTSATQTAAATNSMSVGNGLGGIIVDNDSNDGQASSIYFETLGPTTTCNLEVPYPCAVKLTQQGLN